MPLLFGILIEPISTFASIFGPFLTLGFSPILGGRGGSDHRKRGGKRGRGERDLGVKKGKNGGWGPGKDPPRSPGLARGPRWRTGGLRKIGHF